MATDIPTLAERLRREGFATAALSSNPFLDERFGLARGFDTYDNASARRADDTVDGAVDWIARQGDREFFLLVHLMDPHLPYDAPAPAAGRFVAEPETDLSRLEVARLRRLAPKLSAAQRQHLVDAYDEEIWFVDAEIGRLFDALQRLDRWSRALVVLTSDHGEEFFDHGYFEHGHSQYEELLRVPLLAWGPAIEPRREEGRVSTIDLAPTILHAVGAELAADEEARSLWPYLRRGVRLGERHLVAEQTLYGPERKAILQWPFKLLINLGDGRRELYDLESDPDERFDLSERRPDIAEDLAVSLLRLLEGVAASSDAQVPEVGGSVLEELKALGYVD